MSQQHLIKKYFNSLVQEFIKDPLHNQYITIVFTDYIKKSASGDTLGLTKQTGGGSETTWKTVNERKVPGSERTTYFPYKYTITFLNRYEDEERWRGTVTHEFAHLYLFATVGDHDHDDRFYSHMEKFENWMDNKWGLSPRKYKGGDRIQHTNPNKQKQGGKQSFPSEQDELKYLESLLDNSKTLTELENNWQTVKSNSLYDSSKRTVRGFSNAHELPDEDNETRLDRWFFNCLIDLFKKTNSLSELENNWKIVKSSHFYNENKYNWKDKSLSNKSGLDNEYSILKSKYDKNDDRERERERQKSHFYWAKASQLNSMGYSW